MNNPYSIQSLLPSKQGSTLPAVGSVLGTSAAVLLLFKFKPAATSIWLAMLAGGMLAGVVAGGDGRKEYSGEW
ncbi:MAG: hypothetical protein WCG61_04095 [Chlorobium sp.]